MGVKFNPFTSKLDIVDSPSGEFSDIELALGTQTAPSLSFTGDPNTGIYSPGADQVALTTAGSERVRIDSSGRLLVGTSTSTNNIRLNQKLAIVGTGANQYGGVSITTYSGTNDVYGSIFDFNRSAGTTDGSMTSVNADCLLGRIHFRGSDGTNFVNAATIDGLVDGTPGANDMPGRLVFSTTADGASSPTERMRIKASGIVNIANTPTYADNAAALLGGLVAGDVYRKSDGTLMITY